MFNYPATELFRADERRVVWSQEEFETALAEGWSEEKPAGRTPPTLETVIGAGYSAEAAESIVADEQRKFAAGIKPYGPNEDAPPASAASERAAAEKQANAKKTAGK